MKVPANKMLPSLQHIMNAAGAVQQMSADICKWLAGDQAKQIQPVFISIDPERDSVPQVREYVKEFYPGMVGLTGPVDKVRPMCLPYPLLRCLSQGRIIIACSS